MRAKIGAYIDLLNNSLNRQAVNTVFIDKLRFWWLVKQYNVISVIHFQYLHDIYQHSNRLMKGFQALSLILNLYIARFLGYKIFWTVHNILSHDNSSHIFIDKLVIKVLLRVCNGVFVHNEYTKLQLLNEWRFKKLTYCIYHGNFIGYYPNTKNREQARLTLSVKDNDFVFLFFGRIRPYKGIEELIDAFSQNKQNNLVLIIAGLPAGHDWNIEKNRKEIENKCQDHRIKLHLHWIENDSVQDFFNAADIVVLPFRDITTSGSLLLAMSFGKPVIAPTLGGIPEVLKSEFGILIPDTKKLSDALRKAALLDCKDMGYYAYREALKYDWEYIALITKRAYFSC